MAIERLSVILDLVTGNYKREAREAATATSQIGTAAQTSSGQVGIFGQNTANVSKHLKGLATGALLAAGAGLLKFGADSIKAASTLEESMNAVRVVFGETADTIIEFGEEAAVAAGLAQGEFQQMASVIGSALKNAGFDADTMATKTIELTQRAADMASVFNTTVPDALSAIQAALRGETDPIERYGVGLNAAAVEAEAASLGFKKVSGELTVQAKAAARLSLIMKQTDQVAGDFTNTSDGLANKSKILSARFTDLQADIGQGLIPIVLDAIDAIEPLLDVLGFVADKLNEIDVAVQEGRDAPSEWAQTWAIAADIAKGAIFGMVGILSAVFDEENALRDNTETVAQEIHDSWMNVPPAMFAVTEAISGNTRAFSNAAAAADKQRTAMIKLVNAAADLLDPVGNVLRLTEELETAQEHLAEVQEDGDSTARDLALAVLEVEQAFLRLQGAGAELTPDQIQAFSLVLIEELGLSEVQALRTLEALNLLDGWTGTASFTLKMNEIASGGGGGSSNINSLFDQFGFASGGIVPGPMGSQQVVLAHGGETILPTHRGGNWGGNTTIVVQSPMNDFRSDMQYATILASVTNLVEAG